MERVLLLSMGFGSGHNAAAKALQVKFEEQQGVVTELVDLLELIPKTFHPFFQAGYFRMLMKFPNFYHFLYDWTYQSKVIRYFSSELIEKMGWTIRRKINQQLKRFNPTKIVTTHPFALLLIPNRWLRVPTVGVVTDYELHPIWLGRLPDVLCMPKKLVEQREIERIQLQVGTRMVESGLPIHAKYFEEKDPIAVRKNLGLPLDRPVVLVMGGGHGLGPIESLVDQLTKLTEIQCVVFTGENNHLRKVLEEKNYGDHIRIEGFRSDLEDWMSAADLLITKPGGVTITEAIAKRLPMLLFEAFPGQEEANKKYLLHHRVAFPIKVDQVGQQVQRLFTARFSYDQMNRSFDQINPQYAADMIVHETLRMPRVEAYVSY